MCYADLVQRAVDLDLPKIKKFGNSRKVRTFVVGLPDKGRRHETRRIREPIGHEECR